ncbi:heterokaryon incompatibility protein-domain-containing protein, partial [Coniella lustricola]
MVPSSPDSDDDFYTPTRLLDVDKAHGNRIFLRLQEDVIAQNGPQAGYVTLSHCWDSSPRPGIAMIEAISRGIAIDQLPRTFQDAVAATRRLGFGYLWIDSLCILQDSKEDWEREASEMNLVYIKASVTLAADGSRDSRGGLYKTRSPAAINPTIVSPQWSKSLRRDWCLQERFLSAAVIHFGETQLAFECRAWEACETFPTDAQDEVVRDELSKYYVWCRLIEKYARTDITHDSDKLVAVYGMAKVVHFLLEDTYIGGMWLKVAASQLLWSTRPALRAASRNPLGRRPAEKNAPTWSWASVKGPI